MKKKVFWIIAIFFLFFALTCFTIIHINVKLDPSRNDDILFVERYFKIELPQSKEINILEGDRNSKFIKFELTVKKADAEEFLKSIEITDFAKSSDIYDNPYENALFGTLLDLAKKDNSISFSKWTSAYSFYMSLSLRGVCYDTENSGYKTIFIIAEFESEKELINDWGNDWYTKKTG